jgi:protease YdgD
MGLRHLLPAILATILVAGPAHAAEETEQIAVRPAPHPTAAVGLVLKDGVGTCTGSLIAPDLVLTAAHCAEGLGPDRSRPDPVPDRRLPRPHARGHPAARIVLHPLYPTDAEQSGVERRTGYDLALLRLAAPVPAEAATPLVPARDVVAAPRLLIASYRGGRGERARERTCPVIDATDRMIRMGCDVRPGESGCARAPARAGRPGPRRRPFGPGRERPAEARHRRRVGPHRPAPGAHGAGPPRPLNAPKRLPTSLEPGATKGPAADGPSGKEGRTSLSLNGG